jgi:rubredoxin
MGDRSGWRVSVQPAPWVCPTCGDPLRFEILDDEAFLVAWSCLSCGLVRVTEPA